MDLHCSRPCGHGDDALHREKRHTIGNPPKGIFIAWAISMAYFQSNAFHSSALS